MVSLAKGLAEEDWSRSSHYNIHALSTGYMLGKTANAFNNSGGFVISFVHDDLVVIVQHRSALISIDQHP